MIKSGDLASAEEALRKAAALAPHKYTASLASVLIRRGKREEAIALQRQAAEDGGTNANLYFVLGQMLASIHDIADAETAYRKAFDLDPSAPGYRNNLVSVLSQRGMYTEALALVRAAIAADGGDANTYSLLGKVLNQARELDGAETAIRKAMELEPGVLKFRIDLLQFLNEHRRPDEARKIVYELAGLSGADFDTYHRIGRLLLFQYEDLPEAEIVLRKAAELNRRDPNLRVTQAELLYKQKRFSQALAILSELRAEGANSERLDKLWDDAIAHGGGLPGVEEKLRKALAANPESSGLRSALAAILSEQGLDTDALAVLGAEDGLQSGTSVRRPSRTLMQFIGSVWPRPLRGRKPESD